MAAREELREFLRSRRARIDPADVGLSTGLGPRRVTGLRREELAHLAGVSVDYYVRLEQGRDIIVSEEVLTSVARALRLDDDERAHLFDLARPASVRRRAKTPRPQRVRPGIRVLMDATATPAFVVGRRMDLLATNRMTRALLCDFDARPPRERNHARWVFLDPAAPELYLDWESIARDNVATLRMNAGRHPDDQELSDLVGELTVKSPEFARWWANHEVLRRSHGTKRFQHPLVGELAIAYEALPVPDDPGPNPVRLHRRTRQLVRACHAAARRLDARSSDPRRCGRRSLTPTPPVVFAVRPSRRSQPGSRTPVP